MVNLLAVRPGRARSETHVEGEDAREKRIASLMTIAAMIRYGQDLKPGSFSTRTIQTPHQCPPPSPARTAP